MKAGLLSALLIFTFTAFSQERKISGKVIDSAEMPIYGIIVSLINANNKTAIAFKHTSKDGEFTFIVENANNTPLQLEIKSSFYKSALIEVKPENEFYSIKLIQQIKQLTPVEVKANKPLIRKTGDTLRYNLNAFANNNDRVIADVLPKIPGVEVGNNGIIKYNGMPISNFFIEGDNILDKRYNIATNNISKDLIDEIQILENNQPIKVLQGIVIPTNAAMNITFKKGFKGKVINDIGIGVGIPKLLEAEYNQVILNTKLKAINYLKYNNTGTDYLLEHTKQDLSELGKQLEVNWREKLFSLNTITPPAIQNFRYNLNSNAAASFNLLFKLKNDFTLRSNSYILSDKNLVNYYSKTEIYLPNINLAYRENQNITKTPSVLYEEVILNKNTDKYYMNNKLIGESSRTNYNASLVSTNQVEQQLKERNYNLSNEFKYIKKINARILNFNSYTEWNKNPQSLFISQGILKNVLNDSFNYAQTQQFANNKIFFSKNQLSYNYKKMKLKYAVSLGITFVERKNNTFLLLQNNNITYKPLNGQYNNEISSTYTTSFSSLNIIYENDNQKIDLAFSPSLISIKVNSDSLNKNYPTFFTVSSSISLKQQLGRESSLRLLYSYKTEPAEAGNIFENSYLQNYRSFYVNSQPYLPETKHNIYLNYNFQRSLKLFFLNLTTFKTYAKLGYVLDNEIMPSYSIVSYSLLNNKQTSFNASLNISKYLFKSKSTIGFKILYLQRNFFVLQNGVLIDYTNNNKQFIFSFRPTIADFIQFNTEVSYNQFYNIPKSYIGNVPKVSKIGNLSSFDILLNDQLSFKLKGELLTYKNTNATNANSNYFIDIFAKLTTKNKGISYELKLLNILNRKSYLLQQSDINFVQLSEYELRPLTLLVSARIKL